MKSKWIIAGVLIVVLIALCGASLLAVWQGLLAARSSGVHFNVGRVNTVEAKDTEEKTLSVSGPVDLTVENDFGFITVQTGTDDKVTIKADKTAWGSSEADAQQALKDLKVVIEQNGNKIRITLQRPAEVDVIQIGPSSHGNVNFTVTVPTETQVNLRSFNGDLTLSGTKGDAELNTDFGGVDVRELTGGLSAATSNGKVSAENVNAGTAPVTLKSDFGDVTAKAISGGDVTVKSTNGGLDLSGLNARVLLQVSSDFGGIKVNDSQADVADVKSNNGAVELENLDVEGKITVRSDFGDLTLTKVDANAYDLNTQNGKISVDGARGAVKAHSDFGELEVLNAENVTLDLSSNNGGVTFSGSLAEGPHSVTSEFGNIKLTLPAETGLNVDIQTEFGKITSDFEITVSGELNENHWKGKFNGGGEDLTIKTQNGNITLQSSK